MLSTGVIYDKKKLLIAAITGFLVLISWLGILDTLSYDYLNGSLLSALSSYGLSRALNGIISVLQSSTLSVGIASVSVGELLDPINDIIERFSGLLTLSIASIIVQKVLLNIVSSVLFKLMLSISGLGLLISLCIRTTPYIQLLSRLFLLLVFLRLALSFMLILTSAVDNSFLTNQINANYENVNAQTEKLDTLKNEILKQNQQIKKAEKAISVSKKERMQLMQSLLEQNKKKQSLDQLIRNQRSEIEHISNNLTTFERYNFMRKDQVLESAEFNLSKQEQQLERVLESIDREQSSIAELDKDIDEYESNKSEKPGGWVDGIAKVAGFVSNNSIENVKRKLVEIRQDLDFIVNNLLVLMSLYIIKTILFPILFMYLLVKAFKLIWAIELSFNASAKKVRVHSIS